jgi:hypothetical protein
MPMARRMRMIVQGDEIEEGFFFGTREEVGSSHLTHFSIGDMLWPSNLYGEKGARKWSECYFDDPSNISSGPRKAIRRR